MFRSTIFATAVAAFLAATPAQAGFNKLHDFGVGNDGRYPHGAVIEGSDGKIYGTTTLGGPNNGGTVWRCDPDGSNYEIIKAFGSVFGESAGPYGEIIEGPDGFLYGVSSGGGVENEGTVFKIAKSGAGYAKIHDFDTGSGQGALPFAGPLMASDGKLYGVTRDGGTSNRGTIFTVGTAGTGFATLHSFGINDGDDPQGELVEGPDGRLYGMTVEGGTGGEGILFAIQKNGAGYTILRNFGLPSTNGENPYGRLRSASDGFLYGVTYFGGTFGHGVIFRLRHDGSSFSVIHHFNNEDGKMGRSPYAGVTESSNGFLYGTCFQEGANGGGTIFRIAKNGKGFKKVFDFEGFGAPNTGRDAIPALAPASNGKFYSTGYFGGADNEGVLYTIDQSEGGVGVDTWAVKIVSPGTKKPRSFNAGGTGLGAFQGKVLKTKLPKGATGVRVQVAAVLQGQTPAESDWTEATSVSGVKKKGVVTWKANNVAKNKTFASGDAVDVHVRASGNFVGGAAVTVKTYRVK